jgi:hypothetical protein
MKRMKGKTTVFAAGVGLLTLGLVAALSMAREASLPQVDFVSLSGRAIGSPRFADHIVDPEGTGVRPEDGFRLVIVPIQVMAPRGELVISDLDLSVVAEDGARYGAAAVGWDGTYAVPTDEYNVRICRPCEEPTRMIVEAAFIVPTEAKRLRLRIATPVGDVMLD